MRQRLVSQFTPRPLRVVVVGVMASLVFSAAAMAAAGDLDPTFSGDGKQRTDFGGLGASSAAAAVVRQADGKIVAVGWADNNFLVARYNSDGSLDTTLRTGRLRTDFNTGQPERRDFGRDRQRGAAGSWRSAPRSFNFRGVAISRSRATTRTARSTRPSMATASETTAFGSFGDARAFGVALQSDGKIVAVGHHQHPRHQHEGLRARALQPERLARHELLRRRQADDRVVLRGFRRGVRGGDPGGRQDRRGRRAALMTPIPPGPSRSPASTRTGRWIRASPPTACRRPTSGLAPVEQPGGDPGRRQDRRGRAERRRATSRSPATSPTGRSTRASPATACRRPTFSSAPATIANDVAIQANGRIVAVGFASGGATGQRLRARPLQLGRARSTPASPATAGGGPTWAALDGASGVALQGDGRIVAVGTSGAGDVRFALARYLGG